MVALQFSRPAVFSGFAGTMFLTMSSLGFACLSRGFKAQLDRPHCLKPTHTLRHTNIHLKKQCSPSFIQQHGYIKFLLTVWILFFYLTALFCPRVILCRELQLCQMEEQPAPVLSVRRLPTPERSSAPSTTQIMLCYYSKYVHILRVTVT